MPARSELQKGSAGVNQSKAFQNKVWFQKAQKVLDSAATL